MLLSTTYLEKTKRIWLITILLLFTLIYCLISLVNHYQFRTFALDLGMFNHALYSFSHFRTNHFTLSIDGGEVNYFSDHFSPITFLYIPFYYLFGSYSLLIIQIAAIVTGGFGIYKYACIKHPDSYIPLFILFQFFGIWAIYSALAFDFHNNVIAAMLLPWFIYYYEKKNKTAVIFFFILLLIAKENMGLWMAFVILGLMLKNGLQKIKGYLKFELPLIGIALLYFVVVIIFIMPSLQVFQGNQQLAKYALLGNSLPEIMKNMIEHPRYVFSLLFENPLPGGGFSAAKVELHFMVLVSGGIALLYRPYYLIMLIPIYAQKMLTNDHDLWGINYQYSIEFAPILSLALVDSLEKIHSKKLQYILAFIFVASTHYFNISTIDHRSSPGYSIENTRFYAPIHYTTELSIGKINTALKLIPNGVPLSVGASLAPHLANRDKIYSFPIVKDAQYIAVFTDNVNTYPLSKEDFAKEINKYKDSGDFSVEYNENDLLILKKK